MAPGIPRAQDELLAPGTSARLKYARLIVGRDGWGALLRYEFVQLASQWVPGALGLALRKALYNYMHGIGLEQDVRSWFATSVPRTRVARHRIARALDAPVGAKG